MPLWANAKRPVCRLLVEDYPSLVAWREFGLQMGHEPVRELTDELNPCVYGIRPGHQLQPLVAPQLMHL